MDRKEIIDRIVREFAAANEREARRNRADDRFLLAVIATAVAVSVLAVILGA